MIGVFAEPDDPAATPLTPEEMCALIPACIVYRHELNEAEQENIISGQEWALSRRHRTLLSEDFVRRLHNRMFGDIWRWAGQFRNSPGNIGIDHWLILVELRQLLDDAKAWIEFGAWPVDEIAVRFHHRLVLIHPFPNGNGRYAWLMADLLVIRLGRERFSSGRESPRDPGAARAHYLAALRAADKHDISPLVAFSRA